jgi:hypothetical protein
MGYLAFGKQIGYFPVCPNRFRVETTVADGAAV